METIFLNHSNLHHIYHKATECVIALGYFDGVHLGHQHVIEVARKEANRRGVHLAVMSFTPHPINVLSEGKKQVSHLSSLSEKESKLKNLGVDLFYLVEFTLQFAGLSPKASVQHYLQKLKAVHAVAGFDFSYGAKGAGNLFDIPVYSNGSLPVTQVECVNYHGEKISSTAIRTRLTSGNVHEIEYFLGEQYEIKAFLKNSTLNPIEQTMLPNTGTYEVELIQSQTIINGVLVVDEIGQLQLMNFDEITLDGIVKIKWLKCIHHSSGRIAVGSEF